MAESLGLFSSSFTPDRLIAGNKQLVTKTITILSGEGVLTRGTLLGMVTDGDDIGKYRKAVTTNTDGSEVPYAILADTSKDATSEDVIAVVYLEGEFNYNAMTCVGYSMDDLNNDLRTSSMYFSTSLGG